MKKEAFPSEIVVGSRNKGKLREIKDVLRGMPVKLATLVDYPDAPEVDETGTSFRENAVIKATTLAKALKMCVLADDSGLEVDALNGEPGVRSARFAGTHGDDEANIRKLLQALARIPLKERSARFRCAIALACPDGPRIVTEGTCDGLIALEPRGTNGFGYDPVFIYPPSGMTFGEMGSDAKNAVSHRARALAALKDELQRMLDSAGSIQCTHASHQGGKEALHED